MTDPRRDPREPPRAGPAVGRRGVREVLAEAEAPRGRATLMLWSSLVAAVALSITLVCVGFLGVDLPGLDPIGGSAAGGLLAIAIGQPVLWFLWLLVARGVSRR